MTRYAEIMERHPLLLAEGSVVERIRRGGRYPLDPHVANAAMIYDEAGSAVLGAIYREYIDLALERGLPILVLTPTWRASGERTELAGLGDRDVNRDCSEFVSRIRDEYGASAPRILIGGLMGCRGDAYDPSEALSAADARPFHAYQAERLAAAGIDLLLASTLPAAGEAAGIAEAMGGCGLPFFLSFVVRADGRLLDGTLLSDAVAAIDAGTVPPPTAYLMNCVHPANARSALDGIAAGSNAGAAVLQRLIGLQGNASRKSPEELDGSAELDADPPGRWAREMIALHRDYGMRILGGCCGTDGRHIARLAELCPRAEEAGLIRTGGDSSRDGGDAGDAQASERGAADDQGAVELPIDGTLDLHTFRADEVKTLIPDYLAAAREHGITQVRIIHGKGTGALRETVHAILRRLPEVEHFRLAGEDGGGWGATIVTLR